MAAAAEREEERRGPGAGGGERSWPGGRRGRPEVTGPARPARGQQHGRVSPQPRLQEFVRAGVGLLFTGREASGTDQQLVFQILGSYLCKDDQKRLGIGETLQGDN